MSVLPAVDRDYLTTKGIPYEEFVEGGHKGIILRQFPLTPGRYDAVKADILVMLPPGYPDLAPDMFYTLPWVKLTPENRFPRAADHPFILNGQSWQRWSRHSPEWRPGVDGIWTFLRRIETAIEVAQA